MFCNWPLRKYFPCESIEPTPQKLTRYLTYYASEPVEYDFANETVVPKKKINFPTKIVMFLLNIPLRTMKISSCEISTNELQDTMYINQNSKMDLLDNLYFLLKILDNSI